MNHIGTIELATERLTLRRFMIEDAESMYYNWASEDEVTRFLTWPTHKSVQDSEMIIDQWIKSYEDKKTYQWAIELNDLEQPIGSISAVKVDDEIDAVEVGYCIGSKYWNKGYATEALAEVIRFFMNEVGASRAQDMMWQIRIPGK